MEKNDQPTDSRWIWLLTMAAACLPVAFGLYQIWIFFDEAFPHVYWSRTLPALAAVALGFAGIVVPMGVWRKRTVFWRSSSARQGAALGGVVAVMAIVYLLPFLLLVKAGRNSRAILDYTPAVVLVFSMDGEDRLAWGVLGGPGTGHGSAARNSQNQDVQHVLVEWHAPLEPMHIPRPPGPDPLVHLKAEGSLDPIRLAIQIENGRTVLFKTLGFPPAAVTQQGKPVALPIELPPGTHGFILEAKP